VSAARLVSHAHWSSLLLRLCVGWRRAALHWRHVRQLEEQAVVLSVRTQRDRAVQTWLTRTRSRRSLLDRVQRWSSARRRRVRAQLLQQAFAEWSRKHACQVNMRALLQHTLLQQLARSFSHWHATLLRLRSLRSCETALLPRVATLRCRRLFTAWVALLRERRLDAALQASMARSKMARVQIRAALRKWRTRVTAGQRTRAEQQQRQATSSQHAARRCLKLWLRAAERRVAFHTHAPALQCPRKQSLSSVHSSYTSHHVPLNPVTQRH